MLLSTNESYKMIFMLLIRVRLEALSASLEVSRALAMLHMVHEQNQTFVDEFSWWLET